MRLTMLFLLFCAAPVAAQEMSPTWKGECERKPTCAEMRDCDEARFYYKHCGGETLDRDGDGEPCEDLCGFKSRG